MITLTHGKVTLALHELRGEGTGRPLLLLHGLGERTPPGPLPIHDGWPGPIYGLDFTGHGESTIPTGGGYTAEVLMGDADAALAHLGEATLLGRGLGAYVAVLVAGGRPQQVRGAVLTDGPGLQGGGPVPGSPFVAYVPPDRTGPPDPFAMAELTRDPRPPDYALAFARLAVQFSGLSEPITVCGVGRPPWLEAVVAEPGVAHSTVPEALAAYSHQ